MQKNNKLSLFIAYDICGPAGASQALGFLFTLNSVPLTLGPTIAGKVEILLVNNKQLFFKFL